jgi:hypothetical protein
MGVWKGSKGQYGRVEAGGQKSENMGVWKRRAVKGEYRRVEAGREWQ